MVPTSCCTGTSPANVVLGQRDVLCSGGKVPLGQREPVASLDLHWLLCGGCLAQLLPFCLPPRERLLSCFQLPSWRA